MVQSHRSLIRAAGLLIITFALSGCPAPAPRPSLPPYPPSPPGATPPAPNSSGGAPQRPPPVPTPPTPPPRENHLSPATQSLVLQARHLLAHGDVDGASTTLDRALRIEPNNPLVWIELGRLRLAENNPHQAEGCGRKALALASGDHAAQRQAGRLLVDALRAQQRNQEAHEIEVRPFMR
jgi:tetratricopeptide (TPR) repeat protein